MRNLLALAAAALLAFAGIGWYLGWYKIETNATSSGRHISIDLNTPKIKEDVGKGKERLRDILDDDRSNSSPASNQQPNIQPLPQTDAQPTSFPRPGGNDSPFRPVPPGGTSPMLPPPR